MGVCGAFDVHEGARALEGEIAVEGLIEGMMEDLTTEGVLRRAGADGEWNGEGEGGGQASADEWGDRLFRGCAPCRRRW